MKNLILIISVIGVFANILSGSLIVIATYHGGNKNWETGSEIGNIVPNTVSLIFLIDALRRFKRLA